LLVEFPDSPRLIEDQGDLVLLQRAALLFSNKIEDRCSSLVRCAHANGHATAPTISVMNSRRLICLSVHAWDGLPNTLPVPIRGRVLPGRPRAFPCLAMTGLVASESDKVPLLFPSK